jgi:periplasmic protein TonB
VMEIPPTEQPPPPPPKVQQPEIIEVPDEEEIEDEIEIDLDVEITEETQIEEMVFEEAPEEEVADEIFTVVEDQPTPKGGMQAFYEYVSKNMKYPAQARRMGVEGRVFVQFVVDKDGTITDVKAVKGIGAGCDEEAVRVLQNAPKWNPGKQRGRSVRVRMVLPITFQLG